METTVYLNGNNGNDNLNCVGGDDDDNSHKMARAMPTEQPLGRVT